MKGNISRNLESILRDPRARDQLRIQLIEGRDGRITVGNVAYAVRVEDRVVAPESPRVDAVVSQGTVAPR